jgi:hypothetical protein
VFVNPESEDKDKEMKPHAERAFKEIVQLVQNEEQLQKLSLLRINRKQIRAFLTQRYNARIASKISAIFDVNI